MIDMAKILKTLTLLVTVIALTGCQQNKDDLSVYVAKVKSQQKSDIPPIPVMKPYEKFDYAAAELRDPFIPTVVEMPLEEEKKIIDNGIRPDKQRLKEALESYGLSELQFVGTLEKETMWGLIRSSDGVIHRVKVGNYMGQNHGRILLISDEEITLNEIVPEGNGAYKERKSSLTVVDVN